MLFSTIFLTVLLLNALSISGDVATCSYSAGDGYSWTIDEYCLEVVFRRMNWYNARNYCANQGGDLVEIRSQRLQDSIAAHLKANHSDQNGFWIGATDLDTEGIWKWNHDDRTMYFTKWNPSQGPHIHGFLIGGVLEDCAMIRVDDNFQWHDGACDGVISSLHYDFICQYNLRPNTTQGPLDTANL